MSLSKFFDKKPLLSFGICAGVILLISVIIFLFTKDNVLNPKSITGAQALAQEGASFWIPAILICAVIGAIVYFGARYLNKGGDSKSAGSVWIAIALLLAVAWGKGCTNKADDGVSSTKGRPDKVEKPNDGRESAEDQLKK